MTEASSFKISFCLTDLFFEVFPRQAGSLKVKSVPERKLVGLLEHFFRSGASATRCRVCKFFCIHTFCLLIFVTVI